MDKGQMIAALKELMDQTEPLPDEPLFATSDETIVRFLKSSDWKLKEAEKALLNTIEYRRQTRPMRLDCKWCHDRPGYHSMRQVGHDESGRPVIYANFAQAATHKNTVEDIVTHVTYLIENAKATMEIGVNTWVFVIDCTGMTLSACNPKLGYGMANILSNHYPERLGLVICVNHNPMFHGVWKALKKVVSPGTSAKVRLVRSPAKIQQVFSTYFSDELSAWLMQEIELNQQKPLPKSQLEFWAAPSSSPFTAFTRRPSHHDPRGCPAYVREHILPFSTTRDGLKLGGSSLAFWRAPSGSSNGADSSSNGGTSAGAGAVVPRHRPHPNIVDSLFGVVQAVSLSPQEQAERLKAMSAEDLEGGACGGLLSAENGTLPVRDTPVKGKQYKVNIISGEANNDSDGFEDDDQETRERKWRE